MADLFDTRSVRDEAAHWDALSERVAERAMRAESRQESDPWFRSRGAWAAASLLFAAALVLMVLSSRGAVEDDSTAWRMALAPPDDVGQVLATRDGPPSIGALVFGGEIEGPRP